MAGGEQKLTVNEAADYLQVHIETVKLWLRSGKIKGRMTSRRVGYRIEMTDLEQFRQENMPLERLRISEREMLTNAATVVSIFNQSGGVGKTTLTRDIGYALRQKNLRVLLVDADPQATLSIFCGLEPDDLEQTIYHWAMKKAKAPIHQIWGLDLIPSNIEWAYGEVELQSLPMGREKRIRVALEPLLGQYDVVLIDCPPSLGSISWNALYAADELLIPVQSEYKGTKATKYLFATINQAREFGHPKLGILAIVPTMLGEGEESKRMHQTLIEQLSMTLPVTPPIRRLTEFTEVSERHLPIQLLPPDADNDPSHAIDDIEQVVQSIMPRLQKNRGRRL
jgi:chromosome partitioning protein